MAVESVRRLAQHLDVPERTLRRAAEQGLIRGERVSERRFRTTLREEAYLRRHWGLLSTLRRALRTEPNVRLAVLFGSLATGEGSVRSDVDLLVLLQDERAGSMAGLSGRLSERLGRDVQLVRVGEAERSPQLMLDVLAQGRVLVDRDGLWPRLRAGERRWRRCAATEPPLEQALPDLEF
jgi:predicted nucleotidyltransferase